MMRKRYLAIPVGVMMRMRKKFLLWAEWDLILNVSYLPTSILALSITKRKPKISKLTSLLISYRVSINDFILLKSIASGAYGKVILARKKNTSDHFAIKVLEKDKMMVKNVIENVIHERDILNNMNNDFIVRGVYSFQSKKYLYMVMEYMKGGDFASLLQEFGCFDEENAKYYLA